MICSTSLKVLLPTTYVPLPTQLLWTPLIVFVLMLALNGACTEPVNENWTTAHRTPASNCFIAARSFFTPKGTFYRATFQHSQPNTGPEVHCFLGPQGSGTSRRAVRSRTNLNPRAPPAGCKTSTGIRTIVLLKGSR